MRGGQGVSMAQALGFTEPWDLAAVSSLVFYLSDLGKLA